MNFTEISILNFVMHYLYFSEKRKTLYLYIYDNSTIYLLINCIEHFTFCCLRYNEIKKKLCFSDNKPRKIST